MNLQRLQSLLLEKERNDPDFLRVTVESPLSSEDDAIHPAEIIEDGPLVRPVCCSNTSAFTHFLDGTEYSKLLGYQGSIPIVFAHTAAAIRVRGEDRRLATYGVETIEALYYPYYALSDAAIAAAAIPTRDTAQRVEHASPSEYRRAAARCVQHDREHLELSLCRAWADAASGWLLIDGRVDLPIPRMVGMIKSHRTQYLEQEQQQEVFRMNEAHRSVVMSINQGVPVATWWLKLHCLPRHDMSFGMARLEIALATIDPNEISELADSVSAWVLAERNPTSFPDPRWCEMLYPILDVEQFLRSVRPSFSCLDF